MIYAENLFVGLAMPLCVALLFMQGMARRFLFFLITGMGVCLLSAYVNGFLTALWSMSLEDAVVFVTPISEECIKFLPLLFFFLVFDPDSDELISAAVAVGLGFATFENCCYLTTGDAGNLRFMLIRGLAVTIMHTLCALAVGYGLSAIRHREVLMVAGLVGMYALAVSFHAIYNLLVSSEGLVQHIGYCLPLLMTLLLYRVKDLFAK